MSNKGIISVPIILTEQQERDVLRFCDTCEDGQGYDVPKDRMKSLARIGLIRTTGFSRYEITDAGNAVVEGLRAAPVLESGNKCGAQMVDCPECSHQWDHFFKCGNSPTTQPYGKPVAYLVQRADPTGNDRLDRPLITLAKPEDWGPAWNATPLYTEQPAPLLLAEDEREKAIAEISEAINRMPYTRKHLAECLYDAGYRKQVVR